jgi:hypothetical protein
MKKSGEENQGTKDFNDAASFLSLSLSLFVPVVAAIYKISRETREREARGR